MTDTKNIRPAARIVVTCPALPAAPPIIINVHEMPLPEGWSGGVVNAGNDPSGTNGGTSGTGTGFGQDRFGRGAGTGGAGGF